MFARFYQKLHPQFLIINKRQHPIDEEVTSEVNYQTNQLKTHYVILKIAIYLSQNVLSRKSLSILMESGKKTKEISFVRTL